MKKEFNLSEKIVEFENWDVEEQEMKSYECYLKEDVKQFIKEILDEIEWLKSKDGFIYIFDEDTQWLYEKIKQIIKQKAGELE